MAPPEVAEPFEAVETAEALPPAVLPEAEAQVVPAVNLGVSADLLPRCRAMRGANP